MLRNRYVSNILKGFRKEVILFCLVRCEGFVSVTNDFEGFPETIRFPTRRQGLRQVIVDRHAGAASNVCFSNGFQWIPNDSAPARKASPGLSEESRRCTRGELLVLPAIYKVFGKP